MATEFAAAHLVMARSGASTVAELAAAGKPSLLIPFAAAADDHQRGNAEVMVQAGAAIMVQEKQLGEPNLLLQSLSALLLDSNKLQIMARQAKTQARPGAAERIAEMLIHLIPSKRP